MKGPRCLATPLAGTAAVLLGLGLLAVPLHRLTSAPPAAQVKVAAVSASAIPAVLRLRTLAPASSLALKTIDGKILLELRDLAPGESEHDAVIPFNDGGVELHLVADFADTETAVFLTVMPDGYEDQQRHAIGSGRIEETLRYEWQPHP
jgi:hypothetical protein